MEAREIWDDFETLPEEGRRQVVLFVAFLKQRYSQLRRPLRGSTASLKEEPFVGMWSDRGEMEDSAGWVRSVREREWGGPGHG